MLLFDLMGLQIPWYYFAERANGNARMLEVLGCNVDDQVHTSTKGVPPILTSIYFPLSGKPGAGSRRELPTIEVTASVGLTNNINMFVDVFGVR